jgi:hypothetical protein
MSRSPTPEETAAIAAAVERLVAETAPPGGEPEETVGPWQRAALAEGVGAKGVVQQHLEGGVQWQS